MQRSPQTGCLLPSERVGPGDLPVPPLEASHHSSPEAGVDGVAPRGSLPLQVFQTLHSTGQSSMVRDWVMLSLSNFTQRTPVAMAMWSLSCFFVSASTSPWVSAMYPSLGPGAPRDVALRGSTSVNIQVDICVKVLET